VSEHGLPEELLEELLVEEPPVEELPEELDVVVELAAPPAPVL
jgi:hypothetical protein